MFLIKTPFKIWSILCFSLFHQLCSSVFQIQKCQLEIQWSTVSLNKRFLPESQIVNLWRLGRPKSYCRVMGTPMTCARCWVLRLGLIVPFLSPHLSLLLLKITYCFRSVNTAIINLDEIFQLMTMCFKNRTSSFALKHLYTLKSQLKRLNIKRIHSNLQS